MLKGKKISDLSGAATEDVGLLDYDPPNGSAPFHPTPSYHLIQAKRLTKKMLAPHLYLMCFKSQTEPLAPHLFANLERVAK